MRLSGIVYTLPFSSAATNGSNNNEKEDESLIVDFPFLADIVLYYDNEAYLFQDFQLHIVGWYIVMCFSRVLLPI